MCFLKESRKKEENNPCVAVSGAEVQILQNFHVNYILFVFDVSCQ